MNIVDSSGWLEYFADSRNAKNFAKAIEDTKNFIVPTISIYEVFKKVLHEKNEELALRVIAHMKQGIVIEMDIEIALFAAKLAHEIKLPMADSLILATARKYNATIWTQDEDFAGLDGIKYFKKN